MLIQSNGAGILSIHVWYSPLNKFKKSKHQCSQHCQILEAESVECDFLPTQRAKSQSASEMSVELLVRDAKQDFKAVFGKPKATHSRNLVAWLIEVLLCIDLQAWFCVHSLERQAFL